MKNYLLLALLLSCAALKSQWEYKIVDNNLDAPYKIAYNITKDGMLKMEQTDFGIALYLTGAYTCGEEVTVDLAIKTKSGYQKYALTCIKSEDNKTVFLVIDILGPDREEFLKDFKTGTEMLIRINDSNCGDEYYKFNLANSSKAVQFMTPK